ncbi:MAG: serine hydrolase [Candidatus Pacebacteria bacterium]|nr:serine hydrolase [Candidatus Paceibacterota bacterium]
MNKFTLLLISILVSLPFWIGINLLQTKAGGILYTKNIPADILKAQINQEPPTSTVESTCLLKDISAESFLVETIKEQGDNIVLLEKKSRNELPIASITKLMTYLVANEFYKNEQDIVVSKEAALQANTLNPLLEGDRLKVEELIPIMLIESSNDAAFALTKVIGEEGFLDLMNLKAKELGLTNTRYYNPTGVDPEAMAMPQDQINYSTASDIANLTKNLIFNHPEFLQIVSQKNYPLYKEGKMVSTLTSTNELIGEIPEVIGGKTGTTDRAGQCLMVIMQLNKNEKDTYTIGVILNSKDRFNDMRTLYGCVKNK